MQKTVLPDLKCLKIFTTAYLKVSSSASGDKKHSMNAVIFIFDASSVRRLASSPHVCGIAADQKQLNTHNSIVTAVNVRIVLLFTGLNNSVFFFLFASQITNTAMTSVMNTPKNDAISENTADLSVFLSASAMVKPTGWHTVKYDCVDGKYLYNRCHLIAYCLAGENANEKNLITGTRYLNIEGMLPYETLTAKYMDNNPDNHVLYRVTPVFIGNELVARGVLMEGYSVEDNGTGINFCVFCYNVQPDVEINYADGESSQNSSTSKSASFTGYTDKDSSSSSSTDKGTGFTGYTDENTSSYVVNISSKKFHKADCKNADKISDKNKEIVNESRDELISNGYEPSKCCNP